MKSVRAAKIVILDDDNNALVLRRSSSHPSSAFQPDLPGGVIEKGETFKQGLVREILEETSLIVPTDSIKFVDNFSRSIFGITVDRSIFVVKIPKSKPRITISWEHDEYSWLPVSQLSGLEEPYQTGVDQATKKDLWSSI